MWLDGFHHLSSLKATLEAMGSLEEQSHLEMFEYEDAKGRIFAL